MKKRVEVGIDTAVLARNYGKIAARTAPARVLCVLKADAYGIGVGAYAKTLAAAGCDMFGVAEPFEAVELQAALGGRQGPDVQILSSVLPDEIEPMVERGVILPVCGIEEAKSISAAAARLRTVAKVHFKIDTGMGRLGILAAEAENVVRAVRALPGLDCEGIFSHLAMAYDPGDPFTSRQIDAFKKLVAGLAAGGIHFKKIHIAASDAINNFPETFKPPFNVVRTGINLHGSFDPNGLRSLDLENALTLKTRIAQVRELPAGTTLGYGRTWCLSEKTRVATICAGYADGLPLALSNKGHVLVNGKRCKILGRISMDYATIDVSEAPEAKAGDEVTCFGRDGEENITPDDWAAIKGTHAYDIICSLGSRRGARKASTGS